MEKYGATKQKMRSSMWTSRLEITDWCIISNGRRQWPDGIQSISAWKVQRQSTFAKQMSFQNHHCARLYWLATIQAVIYKHGTQPLSSTVQTWIYTKGTWWSWKKLINMPAGCLNLLENHDFWNYQHEHPSNNDNPCIIMANSGHPIYIYIYTYSAHKESNGCQEK